MYFDISSVAKNCGIESSLSVCVVNWIQGRVNLAVRRSHWVIMVR